MTLQLLVRPFSFSLLQPLRTATGVLFERRGWLLRLCDGDSGALGWGEVAPLRSEQWLHCQTLLEDLPQEMRRDQLEALIHQGPGAFGFGLGAALAELDGVVGVHASQPWQAAPPPAQLLPAGERMLLVLDQVLEQAPAKQVLTLKWKVSTEPDELERCWLDQLMRKLPTTAKLRLDANGGWDRATARSWLDALANDPRLDWLEQPLAIDDRAGWSSWLRSVQSHWMSRSSIYQCCGSNGWVGRFVVQQWMGIRGHCCGLCRMGWLIEW
jgi:O-succinylbenzoate synthase